MKIITEDESFFDSVIERIKIATKSNNLSGVAKSLGFSTGAFANYKKRNSIPYDRILTLCRSHNISIDWVLTGRVFNEKPINIEDLSNRTYDVVSKKLQDFSLIPFYDVEASAGHGALVDQEQKISEMAFRKDWLKLKGLDAAHCVLIKARGDSMEPTLYDGDLLLVDTRFDAIKDDSIYILQADSHLIVKRVQLSLDGTLDIISDNPRYDKQIISAENSKDIKVIGRLRWFGHEI